MKKITRILTLCLALVMTIGLLTGCESMEERIANLSSVWTTVTNETEEDARAVLESMELYEEEIALVDLTTLKCVKLVEFRTDKTYRFSYDVEATKDLLRQYFETMFDSLYEGRTALNAVYETEFDNLTKEEFLDFYAALYGAESGTEIVDLFVDSAYSYDKMGADWETGTYTLKFNQIMCTIDGKTEAEALGYAIEADTLTLTYVDAVETYTRSK